MVRVFPFLYFVLLNTCRYTRQHETLQKETLKIQRRNGFNLMDVKRVEEQTLVFTDNERLQDRIRKTEKFNVELNIKELGSEKYF